MAQTPRSKRLQVGRVNIHGAQNIHGALNLEIFDTPFVAPITVDGVSALQLLTKIEAINHDKCIIHVV